MYCSCITTVVWQMLLFCTCTSFPQKPLHGQLLHTWTYKWNVYTQVKPTDRIQINLLDSSQPPWSNTNKALLWGCNLSSIYKQKPFIPKFNILFFSFLPNKFVPYFIPSFTTSKTENSWSTNSQGTMWCVVRMHICYFF